MNFGEIMNAIYLCNNEVVSFTYNGGSHPGSTRHVCVIDHTGHLVRCWDYDKGEKRTFDESKIDNVKTMPDARYCDCGALPSFCTPEKVIQGFQADGYKTFTNKDGWIIAVKIPKPVIVNVAVYPQRTGAYDVFLNVGANCVAFYVTEKGELTIQGSAQTDKHKNPNKATLKAVLDTLGL